MITKESLETRYLKLDTLSLLEIISADSGYTPLAISVAIDELKRRNVAFELIEKQKKISFYQPDPVLLAHCLIDLHFIQKLLFYLFWLIWIPRFRFLVRINFREEIYILKLNQANYYSIVGFVFSFIAMAANQSIGDAAWFIWFAGFIVAYLFDVGYNKQKQINKLESIMMSGGDFEWD
jgi:hypothetical protein